MNNKKMGRPTDNPKTGQVKIRLDEDTENKLITCTKKLNLTKSDVIRKGINKVYDELN